MGDLDLTGYEHTVAATLVRLVDDALLPIWDRTKTGPGLWEWRTDFGGLPLVVVINALPDRVLVPSADWPAQMGPTLLGGDERGLFASATLPAVSDRSDLNEALRVVKVLVPDLETATWSAR